MYRTKRGFGRIIFQGMENHPERERQAGGRMNYFPEEKK
jgi:hypothetical protein